MIIPIEKKSKNLLSKSLINQEGKKLKSKEYIDNNNPKIKTISNLFDKANEKLNQE
jgi:hypothetical protein